jgi:hypothetical protein
MFIYSKLGTPGACLGEKRPEKDRNATGFGPARPKHETISSDPRFYRFRGIEAYLGDAKVWCYMFIWPKPGTPGACLGENAPKTVETWVRRYSFMFGSRWSESGCVSVLFGPFSAQTCARSHARSVYSCRVSSI